MLGLILILPIFLKLTSALDSVLPCSNNSLLVQVNTSRGSLFGCHFSNGNNKNLLYYGEADLFFGIPYVHAPVGNLRYQVGFYIAFFMFTIFETSTIECFSDNSIECDLVCTSMPSRRSIWKWRLLIFKHFYTSCKFTVCLKEAKNLGEFNI